ncbi:hypothetical protein [Xanthomonas phage RTH11]|nr:hypothetical protein [Xanthomonas phage RTH11]
MSNPSSNSVLQTLLHEVNQLSGLSLQLQDVTFGTPQLIDASVIDLTHPQHRNSQVRVSAGTAGDGQVRVNANYNRLSLSTLFGLTDMTYPLLGAGVGDYIAAFNTRLKTDLTVNDFLPVQLVEGAVVLQAHPDSLYVFGQVEITVGAASAKVGRIKLEMGQGTNEMYVLQPNGDRVLASFMVPDAPTPELNGATVLTGKNANIQMIIKLVDDNGVPLPFADQPVFDIDATPFSNIQVLDGPTLVEAIKAYDDAGIPYPSWYSPGCWLLSCVLPENISPNAQLTVSVPGRSDIAPVGFNWRIPALKARFSVAQLTQPALKLAPASDPPIGDVFLSFPNYNKDWDDPNLFYQSDAVVLPGSGISGGILRAVDWCKNFNTPTSSLNCKMLVVGEVTECLDIPEWVGLPVKTSNQTHYLTHACTLDKVPDLSTVVFQPQDIYQSRNIFIEGQTFPGGNTDLNYRHTFAFKDIQGLQVEFYPYEDLPVNNGETPL